MIYVLQMLATMNRGGAETFIMNVYRNIDREKVQFDFLLCTKQNDYAQEIEALGGHIFIIEPRNKGVLKYWRSLDRFFKLNGAKYSTVHCHVSSLSSIAHLFFAKKYGVKNRVIHSHSSVAQGLIHKILHYANKPFLSMVATHYLGCSDLALKWLYKGTGRYNQAVMINNGINSGQFAYDVRVRRFVREKLGINDQIVFGHIGRFSKMKNHKFIIDVFHSYLVKYGNAFLLLVGTGELIEQIQSYVNKLNMSKNVLFLGLRSDTANLLQAMDIFLFPSIFEGLAVALVEAQTSGVMVYASDTISRDAGICDNIKFLSLKNNADNWSEYIHNDYMKYVRADKSVRIVEAGFDIKTTVEYLVNKIYTL